MLSGRRYLAPGRRCGGARRNRTRLGQVHGESTPRATARLLVTAADLCDLRGMFDRSRELLERVEALPCRKPRELQAHYHTIYARALMRQRRLSEALTEYGSALRLSIKLRSVKLIIAVSRNLSACLRLAGRFEEAEEQGRAALEYARSHHAVSCLNASSRWSSPICSRCVESCPRPPNYSRV